MAVPNFFLDYRRFIFNFLGGNMKKLLLAAIISLSTISTAALAEIKVGIILGFTGPIESLTPAMRDGAKLAFNEASSSGNLLGGETITILEGDSTCVDSATAAAESLVADGVSAIMGADCSGVTGAINANVAVPNGVLMVSPSATSPGLSKLLIVEHFGELLHLMLWVVKFLQI